MIDVEKKLKDLPQMAESSLKGLEASASLKYKILTSARDNTEKKRFTFPRLSVVLSTVSACLIVLTLSIAAYPTLITAPTKDPTPPLVPHSAAGHNEGGSGQQRALLNIPQGSISITAGEGGPLNSLWAAGGNNFPLIAVNGKYYRQTAGMDVSSLIGNSLGTIEEYTDEPALSPSAIVSNVVLQGEEIFFFFFMGDGMIGANINGSFIPFQRVSFAGNAILAGESLQSTLGFSTGDVSAFELSGFGTVSDGAKVQELASLLLNESSYLSASLGSGSQLLHIHLTNGLTLQLYVDDSTFSACGSWSCPDFQQAFTDAMAQ